MKNIAIGIKRFLVVFGLLIVSSLWSSFLGFFLEYAKTESISLANIFDLQIIFLIGAIANVLLMYWLCKKLQITIFPIPKWNRGDIKIVLLSVLSTVAISTIGFYFLNQMNIETTYNESILLSLNLVLHWATSAFYTIIAAPIIEELLFRGVIMKYCFPKLTYMAIVASSLLFSSVHGPTNLPSLFIYTGIGFVLALVYHKTKRLDITIAIHMLHNLLAFLL